ncbi:MAG: ComEC/Rec2 family competence protein, partial [Planctomycetes bacterium]|nr:ComEC/Rec2 family competence protein [Planctomycetota bacterium]
RAGAGPPAASLGSLAAAAAMAGASGFLQPALRALVAVALAAAGPLLRRRTDPLQALFAAAGLFLLLRPGSLAEPGFQLSFAAVLGILRLAPALGGLLFAKRRFLRRFPVPAADRSLRRRAGDFLERWLPATLAAWFATAPVLVHHFGTFSTVTLPANLLVVPATSLLLLLAPALLLLGAAAPSLSTPLADGAEALLGWTAGAFSSLPGACLELPPPPLALLSLQGALLAAAAIRATPARLLLAALGTAGLAALPPLLSPPRAGPAVLVMDVGHGLAVLAEGGGRRVLFDAGGRGARVAANGILPALRARGALALDALLLSHEDVDHYSAAREVLETVPVGLLVVNGEFGRGAGAREVLAAAEREGVPVARAAAGDRLRWPGLEVRVLHPPRGGWRGGGDNDGSLVVRVAMEGLSALVAGDLEGRGLRRLLLSGEDLRADLLVLPHHGSPGTEGVEVLAAATGARVAAASAGQASPVLESIPSPAAPRLAITAVEGGIEVR